MSAFSREGFEEVGSEMGDGSVLEEGEKKLDELTAEFLRSQDLAKPDPNLIGNLYIAICEHTVRHLVADFGDQELAEDAVEEAFQALYVELQEKKTLPDKVMPFLLAVARNYLRKHARNKKRHRNVPIDAVESDALKRVAADPREAAREPIAAMESDDMKRVARGALDELDETTRRIVELNKEGREWDEIARLVGLPTADAARKKHRVAVRAVRNALGAHYSSCVTSADAEERSWVNGRRSAIQAIDLLPPPHRDVMKLLLVEEKSENEIAKLLDMPLNEVQRSRERGRELIQKKYKLTEEDLLKLIKLTEEERLKRIARGKK